MLNEMENDKKNIVLEKSFQLALRIVKLTTELSKVNRILAD
jgi:hypothetical protein